MIMSTLIISPRIALYEPWRRLNAPLESATQLHWKTYIKKKHVFPTHLVNFCQKQNSNFCRDSCRKVAVCQNRHFNISKRRFVSILPLVTRTIETCHLATCVARRRRILRLLLLLLVVLCATSYDHYFCAALQGLHCVIGDVGVKVNSIILMMIPLCTVDRCMCFCQCSR